MRSITITLSWTEIVPQLVAVLSNNPNNKVALDHLYRMAELADAQAKYLRIKSE